MSNPEQPILDAIDELVDWQMEEGRRRGDGPLSDLVGPYDVDVTAALATLEELRETRRRMRQRRADAPYQEMPELHEGDRVGYVVADGTLLTGTVRKYEEIPPDSGNWTITLG